MNIHNISHADIATCFTNVCQSVSDHTGTDGLNWFSAIGPDLSGLPVWSEHAETNQIYNRFTLWLAERVNEFARRILTCLPLALGSSSPSWLYDILLWPQPTLAIASLEWCF